MTILYGHRGNKDTIENTMIAFNKCKYEGIETDVRLTTDFKIILHHDETLERIYNIPKIINETTYLEIKSKCNTIVLYRNFLLFCKMNKKKCIIDIKEDSYYNITLIIDYTINICKEINFNINNIIFLCWYDILKPRKNINFFRAINGNFIKKNKIKELKNELKFDGICLEYTGSNSNERCINIIKKNNLKVNIYTNKKLKEIKINADFITL